MATSATELVQLLQASEDFSALSDEILQAIVAQLKIMSVAGGEKVITEGDDSDYMFILVSGRLRVSREDKEGKLLLYNEVLPGDCVGETGMILEQARTADIHSLRDSKIAVLDKSAFALLLAEFPVELNKTFSNAIYRHLRHHSRINQRKRAQSFFLVPIDLSIDIDQVCNELHQALSKMGKSLILTADEMDKYHNNIGAHSVDLDKAESENDYIIYQGRAETPELCKQIFHHSDQIVFVAPGNELIELTDIEHSLQLESGYELIRKHLLLTFPDGTTECSSRIDWQKGRNVERVYPARYSDSADYERLSRFLTGNAVGVVLGGGGARGFAHIGVLRAFEEQGIPIDVIGGNSMGAVIGACYVSGIPLDEIHNRILESISVRLHNSIIVVIYFNKKFALQVQATILFIAGDSIK